LPPRTNAPRIPARASSRGQHGQSPSHALCSLSSLVASSQLVLAAQAPPIYSGLPFWLQAVVTNLFLLLPGVSLSRILGPALSAPGHVLIIVWGTLGMVLTVVGGRALLVAAGVVTAPFSAWGFWAGCALVVEALWAVALIRPDSKRFHPALHPLAGGIVAVAIGTYTLVSWGGSAVVPPQQDQDMVLICPTDGLFTHMVPYGLETRYPYQFNKPIALYFFTGASVVLRGELDAARPFCSSAKRAMALMAKDPRERKERLDELRNRDIRRFHRLPQLTSSVRIPTRGIAVLFAVTLFLFMAHFGAPGWWAFLCTAAAVTLPEMFIRSSYAGFTTISLVELLVIAWLYLSPHERHRGGMLFAASFLLALTNHKPLFVVPVFILSDLAACAHRRPLLNILTSWGRGVWQTGIAGGALAGTTAYWLYGTAVNWEIFRDDHVYRDILFRFTHGPDASYPSLLGLWLQWLRNTSFVSLPLGAACIVYLVRRRGDLGRPLALWFMLGTVLASIVDWKQTKHLMLSFPPLALAPGLTWPSLSRRSRVIMAFLIVLTIVISTFMLRRLSRDFAWLPPSKVW